MIGLDRLKAKLAGVAAGCRDAGETAVRLAAGDAREAAAGMAPVDTGRLRASIGATVSGASAEVTANCEYAAAVELGGRGRPSRPFMLPAAQASAAGFFDQARRLAGARIRR